jgi:hypothetical protein
MEAQGKDFPLTLREALEGGPNRSFIVLALGSLAGVWLGCGHAIGEGILAPAELASEMIGYQMACGPKQPAANASHVRALAQSQRDEKSQEGFRGHVFSHGRIPGSEVGITIELREDAIVKGSDRRRVEVGAGVQFRAM